MAEYKSLEEVKLAHPKYSDERAKQVLENSQRRSAIKTEKEKLKKGQDQTDKTVVKKESRMIEGTLALFYCKVLDFCHTYYHQSAFIMTDPEFLENFNKLSAAKRMDEIPEVIEFFENLIERSGS